MIKKRFICFCISLLLLSTLTVTFIGYASNKDIISIRDKEDTFIHDLNDCIEDDQEKILNQMLVELEELSEIEFAVISIPTLNNLTIEEYSYELFTELGIGKKGKDNGILLIFSKSDNKVRLEIGRGLEGVLNDAKCGRILDNYFVPYREENNYTDAAKNTVNALLNILCEEYDIEIANLENTNVDDEDDLPTWVYIVIIILFILLKLYAGGSSGGGYYTGSSGGFSSGSSFGGGRSNGAGASR